MTGVVKGFVGITGAIVAGRAIAKFGKDSLAAAEAAGRLPPIFKEIKSTSAELKEEFGTALGRTFEPLVEAANDFGQFLTDDLAVVNAINAALSEGVITQKEMNDLVEQRQGFSLEVIGTTTSLAGVETDRTRKVKRDSDDILTNAEALAFIDDKRLAIDRELRQEQAEIVAIQREENALSRERLGFDEQILQIKKEGADINKIEAQAAARQRQAQAAFAKLTAAPGLRQIGPPTGDDGVTPLDRLQAVDVGVLGGIQQEQDRIEFLKAGGQEVIDTFARLQEQLANNETSIESYELSLQKAEIRALAVAAAVGQITLDAAARELMDDLNITYAEALSLLQNINTELDSIDGRKATATVNIVVKGGIAGEIGNIKVGGIDPDKIAAAGGSMTVPPGFPNDSFTVGVTSGEQVAVLTPGQQRNQGGGADMSVLEGKFDRLSSDMKNMVQDMTQAIAERG